MRWRGRRTSENVEDRRSMGGPVVIGGGLGLMVIALIIALLGGNPQQFLQQARQGQAGAAQQGQGAELTRSKSRKANSPRRSLADTEDVWTKLFAESGKTYSKPKLRLFQVRVQSACGMATAQRQVRFIALRTRRSIWILHSFSNCPTQMGAPGDFAQAYVIAHEVGHHVQKQLGYTDYVENIRRTRSEAEANDASVRLELASGLLCRMHVASRAAYEQHYRTG